MIEVTEAPYTARDLEEISDGRVNSGVIRRWISCGFLHTVLDGTAPPKGTQRKFTFDQAVEIIAYSMFLDAGIRAGGRDWPYWYGGGRSKVEARIGFCVLVVDMDALREAASRMLGER